MQKTALNPVASLCYVLLFVTFMTGVPLLSAHYTGGGATLLQPSLQPSVGGPVLTVIEDAPLHPAAAEAPVGHGQIERIMLGTLLVLAGYALHALLSEYAQEKRTLSHRRTRRR